MAGNEALPVHSFLIRLDHFHTQGDVFNILDHGLAPGSGVTVHEVNKLSDHEYRISLHVAPRDKYAAQELATSLIEKALTETAMMGGPTPDQFVQPGLDYYGTILREFFKGVAVDVEAGFRRATSALGGGAKDVLGIGIGPILIAVGVVIVLVFVVARTRSAAA